MAVQRGHSMTGAAPEGAPRATVWRAAWYRFRVTFQAARWRGSWRWPCWWGWSAAWRSAP